MRKGRALCAFMLFTFGCTPALPPAEPEAVYTTALKSSWAAALETRTFAAECRQEAERSEKLAAEARKMLEEAKALQKECAAIVKRIPRHRPRPKPPEPEPEEQKPEKTKPEAEAAKPKLPKTNEGPLYSPSDAP